MAENIPPGSASKVAVTKSESTARGVPYYEKLRRDLRDTLQKKRILDKNMVRPPINPSKKRKKRGERKT
jgi:chromatin modification-related protein EAF6